MALSRGFAPIAAPTARMLVLGSLPGRASLAAAQYYAQPRNAFWPLMGELFGAGPDLPYGERTQRLTAMLVAVWDVCAAAERDGSLDASIAWDTVCVNDFTKFLRVHPHIRRIAFNGQFAANLYRRRVLPGLDASLRAIPLVTLPSTSPAYAAMPFLQKKQYWAVLRDSLR